MSVIEFPKGKSYKPPAKVKPLFRKPLIDDKLHIMRAKLSRWLRSGLDVCIGQMFQLSDPNANFGSQFIDNMRRACNEGCVIEIRITPRDSTQNKICLTTSFEKDE